MKPSRVPLFMPASDRCKNQSEVKARDRLPTYAASTTTFVLTGVRA